MRLHPDDSKKLRKIKPGLSPASQIPPDSVSIWNNTDLEIPFELKHTHGSEWKLFRIMPNQENIYKGYNIIKIVTNIGSGHNYTVKRNLILGRPYFIFVDGYKKLNVDFR